mmetsp:Transcript_4626/g.6023  ORF Transcript_4626/g.6023 Transcript_4626/m.6023 type:complete len:104 (-) Transcript_4626:159-470(-)
MSCHVMSCHVMHAMPCHSVPTQSNPIQSIKQQTQSHHRDKHDTVKHIVNIEKVELFESFILSLSLPWQLGFKDMINQFWLIHCKVVYCFQMHFINYSCFHKRV